jgi:hypothetical protein
MDLLWRGANFFNWHPGRALVVALIVWGLYLLSRRLRTRRPQVRTRPLLVLAGAWTLFTLMELEAWRSRANIRVDLLVTWPAIVLLTLVCCGLWLHSLSARGGPSPPNPSL